MKTMSAKEAKNAFGLLIDSAIADPVVIERHGRPIVVVVSYEEFERMRGDSQTNQAVSEKVA